MGTEDAGTDGGLATRKRLKKSMQSRRMGTEDAGTGGVRARGTTNQPITTITINEA